jgi:hypothetical protein
MSEPLIVTGQLTLAGLLLVLLTVWLNHLLANTRDAKNCRTNEGTKIIDVFTPELNAIIHTGGDVGGILTTEAFKRHESAIRNFLPYLSWLDRFRLRRAWHALAYTQENKKHRVPAYVLYADCGSLTTRREMRPLAIKRIQKIISIVRH